MTTEGKKKHTNIKLTLCTYLLTGVAKVNLAPLTAVLSLLSRRMAVPLMLAGTKISHGSTTTAVIRESFAISAFKHIKRDF